MNQSLEQLRQTIRSEGVVRGDVVEQLKAQLAASGPVTRDEVDLLFDLHAAATQSENDPSWPAFFVETVTQYALASPDCVATLDDDRAAHLLSKLDPEGKLHPLEVELLVTIHSRAEGVPDGFFDYLLVAIRQAILDDGPISHERVEQVRRVVYARGNTGREGVDRRLASFLFDLNDAIADRPNHAAWTALFVEAISDHVLDDEESPGEVDHSEAKWLIERIEADGQYDETEKALLAKIRHFVRHDEVWGGVHSDDLQAATSGVVANLYSRACDGGKGGDMYYFSVSASDMLTRIAVADVLGHGKAVSEIGEWLYGTLASRMNNAEGNQVLADLNRMAAERGYKALTTAVIVTYYRPDSSLYFAYAGHPPIFLRQTSTGQWQPVELDEGPGLGNLPLGVDSEMRYDQQRIPLAQGDRLFLYTDGLVEAPDADRQVFGNDRLVRALEAGPGRTAREVKDAVLAALRQHTGGNLSHDDVTFMVVEVR